MKAFIGIISIIGIIYVIWQYQELKKFQVTHYELHSEKISKRIKIAAIADLHSFSYGTGNERLFRAVLESEPDLILIPGDMIVTAVTEKYEISLSFARQLCTLGIPVIYSNGNHESRAELPEFERRDIYREYRESLEQAGVQILNNESREYKVNGVPVCVSGLELPLSSYEKWKKPYLEKDFIQNQLGTASRECLQILLAHHPAFAEQYASWGADVTVCGHNHGGLIYIPGAGSIISPQFMPFPKYDVGEFEFKGKKVFISRGLGTHTFHIRIFNRAELVVITAESSQSPGS